MKIKQIREKEFAILEKDIDYQNAAINKTLHGYIFDNEEDDIIPKDIPIFYYSKPEKIIQSQEELYFIFQFNPELTNLYKKHLTKILTSKEITAKPIIRINKSGVKVLDRIDIYLNMSKEYEMEE